jgi:hypothetical protein
MLTPQSHIKFGKHKGEKLSDIYRYSPTYLEWAILNVDGFVLDLDKFKELPKPMPVNALLMDAPIVNQELYDSYLHKILLEEPEASKAYDFFQKFEKQMQGWGQRPLGGFIFDKKGTNLELNIRETKKYIEQLALKGLRPDTIDYKFPKNVVDMNKKKAKAKNKSEHEYQDESPSSKEIDEMYRDAFDGFDDWNID